MSGVDNLIEVDGVRLAVRGGGSGTPSVVCLSCAGGAHDEWDGVAARLIGRTQVITYGRPTLGGSDPLPPAVAGQTLTIGWAVEQLRALLQRAGIDPPYVWVTSSVGSWIADQYTARWPGEVAGMVLLDPTTMSPWPKVVEKTDLVDGGDEGCIRWSWPGCYAELAGSVPTTPARPVVVSSSDGRWERDPPPPPYEWWHPLTLPEVDRLWQGFQRDWVHRLSALHVVADTAGHFVHRDEPDLVAYVVAAVVDAARADRPVGLDPQRLADAAGRLRLGGVAGQRRS